MPLPAPCAPSVGYADSSPVNGGASMSRKRRRRILPRKAGERLSCWSSGFPWFAVANDCIEDGDELPRGCDDGDELLLAGLNRLARIAQRRVQLVLRRPGREGVATGALDRRLGVIGVDVGLHGFSRLDGRALGLGHLGQELVVVGSGLELVDQQSTNQVLNDAEAALSSSSLDEIRIHLGLVETAANRITAAMLALV